MSKSRFTDVRRPLRASGVILLMTLFGCVDANPNLAGGEGTDTDGASTGQTDEGTTMPGTSATTTPGTSGPSTSTTSDDDTGATSSSTEDDADVTTDAEPVCFRDSHLCVEPAPRDWSGPVTILAGSTNDPSPSCGNDYPSLELTAYDDLSAPPAVCDCSCTSPANVNCSSVQLGRYSNDACFALNPPTFDGISSCTNISTGPGAAYWYALAALPNNVSCTTSPSSEVPDASFLERFTLCGGTEDIGGCDPGESCVPRPPEESDGRVCIYAVGDLMCPTDSEYTDRSVYYDDFTDDRGCTSCSCGSPTGSCSGTVLITDTACGAQLGANQTISTETCSHIAFNVASATDWSQNGFTANCESSGGNPTGSAAPTDAVTVCCR